jgi:hypothetical protein
MTTTHTPGPWAYHFEPTLGRHIVRAGFAGERNICVEYGAGLKSYEAAANACLIAASPDLLMVAKRLQWLASELAVGNEYSPGNYSRWADEARAAIDKAMGS